MATANTPTLAQSLASLVQSQLAQLHSNPALPTYDYSNLSSNVIDPQQYATGSSNAQYDPQINALQHQIDLNPGQTKLDQSNISDWYAHALKTYNAGAANASHQYDNAQNQLGDSAQGFMAALGGSANSANSGIANQALIAQAMLAGNRNADVNLDTNMQGLIPLAEAQAHTNETGRMGKSLDDLRSQLGSLKGAKGAAYQAALQDATGKKFDQLSGIDKLNADASQNTFADRMSKRQDNTSTASSIMNGLITSMLAPGQMTAQSLSNKLTGANIKGVNAKTNLIANPGINLSRPGDVQALQKDLSQIALKSTIDPTTGASSLALAGDPVTMWNSIKGQLKNLGTLNPQGLSVARNWVKTYLPKGWFFDAKGNLTNNTKVAAAAKAAALTTANTGDFRSPNALSGPKTGQPKPPKAPDNNPNSYDPTKDPIVAAGPPGTGTAKTRSGRYVDVNKGAYIKIH